MDLPRHRIRRRPFTLATSPSEKCRVRCLPGGTELGRSMKGIRWFCVLMIVLCGVSQAQTTAPAASPRGRAARGPVAPAPEGSYPEIRIAAVVNDEVISVSDLASRIRMVMLSTSIPDTPQARQRLAAQVLRQLIDEKLQIQEAKHKNITATDAEIKKAIATIERQNNMKPG